MRCGTGLKKRRANRSLGNLGVLFNSTIRSRIKIKLQKLNVRMTDQDVKCNYSAYRVGSRRAAAE
jgi:hypothetical protein